MTPESIYSATVTAEACHVRREATGDGMAACKRHFEKVAMRKILSKSNCDPGVRFILRWLIEDV